MIEEPARKKRAAGKLAELPPAKRPKQTVTAAIPAEPTASSSSTSAVPPADPSLPTPAQVSKRVRPCIKLLLAELETLDSELFLLRRLHYKYGRAYRSQKWYQPVDGVRRCCERVLGSDERKTVNGRSYEYDAQGSQRARSTKSGENAKAPAQGSKDGSAPRADSHGGLALRKGAGRDALSSLNTAWASMWTEADQKLKGKKQKQRKDKRGQPLAKSLDALL